MFHDVNPTLARRRISNLRPRRPLLTLAQRQFAIWDMIAKVRLLRQDQTLASDMEV